MALARRLPVGLDRQYRGYGGNQEKAIDALEAEC